MLPDFDPEFASPADYANFYRQIGMQVVPAFMPFEAKAWKRPYLQEWKKYTNEIVSQELFDGWYGKTGQYSARCNMGLITGVGPRRIVVVDLDTHKNGKAQIWWDGIHAEYNAGIMSECPTQRTGGGGYQMFFIAPEGWTCPTGTNSELGVDVRGAGGFAMLPPSKHESGNHYDWLEDQEPWTIELDVMPDWMCREIEQLFPGTSGQYSSGTRVHTSTPEHKTDEWGKIIDGREDRMFRMIFRAIVNEYRQCPIMMAPSQEAELKRKTFDEYVDIVETRIREIGTPKHILLEREGRGKTLFEQKWRSTMRQWDTKISEEAQRPWTPREESFESVFQSEHKKKDHTENNDNQDSDDQSEPFGPERPAELFRVWDIEDLKNLPPPNWIWEDIIIEGGSHFFAAAPGVGKTFIGMGLCIAIATGMNSFLGRKVNKQGMVIYITTEGLYDHYKRVHAFEEEYGVKLNRQNYIVIPDALNLLKDADRIRLLKTIDWEVKYRGKGEAPAIVVYDTISKVIPGADENAQQDTSLFLKIKTEIKQMFNTTDLGMHHIAKHGDGGMRGSTTFEGDADGIYLMEREKGAEELIFKAFKNKAAPDGWEMVINLKTVCVDGFSTSLVPTIRKMTDPEQKADFGGRQETGYIFAAAVKMTIEERDEILRGAKEAWDKGDPWSLAAQTKYTQRYAPIWISKVLKKRIKNDSHALLVARAFVELGLWSVEIRNSDTKMKGLKVLNMYQNGTGNLRESTESRNTNLRENEE